jgi:hypothetical protein
MELNKNVCILTGLWLAFVATVGGANWTLATFGIVPIGFGLSAPAGVYFAGIGFTIRDLIHDRGGRLWIVSAIVVGAAVSALLEGAQGFAIASGCAFLLSESADWLIYTPLRRRGWVISVACSNVVGLVVDSVVFLWLAFGSLDFIEGQIVGKAYMTIVAIILLWLIRTRVHQRTK